jgi:hypothetical protein
MSNRKNRKDLPVAGDVAGNLATDVAGEPAKTKPLATDAGSPHAPEAATDTPESYFLRMRRGVGEMLPEMGRWEKYAYPTAMAVLLLATPFFYGYLARFAINCDPFIYGQNAKEILQGERLYSEIWVDKPVLTPLLYAVPQLLFPRSYEAIAVFGSLGLVLQAALCWWVFRASRALALAAVAFVTFFPVAHLDYVWPSTEHFANLFATGNLLVAYAIISKRRFTLWQCAAVGALSCLAFHVRQTAILSGAVPFAAVAMAEASWRRKTIGVAVMFCGGVAALAAAIGLVVKFGDPKSYFNAIFLHTHSYASTGNPLEPVELTITLLESGLGVLFVLFLVMSFASRYRWPALIAAIVGLAQCLSPMRAFEHYWVGLFPYVIFLSALALDRSIPGRGPLALIYAAVLLIVMSPQAAWLLKIAGDRPTWHAYQHVAAAVDRAAPGGGTLLVFGPVGGCEPIQFASTLAPAHMVWTVFGLDPPVCNILPHALTGDDVFAAIMAKPPTVLAIRADYAQSAILAADPKDLPRSRLLIRSLVGKYRYEQKENVEGYIIAVLAGQKG